MIIGRLIQRQVILLPHHMALSLIGEDIGGVLSAYADNRVGVQICLLDYVTGIVLQISGQLFNKKFSFDFHFCKDLLFLYKQVYHIFYKKETEVLELTCNPMV